MEMVGDEDLLMEDQDIEGLMFERNKVLKLGGSKSLPYRALETTRLVLPLNSCCFIEHNVEKH